MSTIFIWVTCFAMAYCAKLVYFHNPLMLLNGSIHFVSEKNRSVVSYIYIYIYISAVKRFKYLIVLMS